VAKSAKLLRFSNQPVAEIVQCGEPLFSFAQIRALVERLNGGRRKAFTTERGVRYDCFHGALVRAGLSECPTYRHFVRVPGSEVPRSRTPGWLHHDPPSQLALASVAPAARLDPFRVEAVPERRPLSQPGNVRLDDVYDLFAQNGPRHAITSMRAR